MAGARQGATAKARARAREAKARLDAERASEEKRVEDLVTKWYVTQDEHEQAEQALAAAEAARASVVAQLLETQSVDRVAGLCGLERGDVGRLRRRAAADARAQGEVGVEVDSQELEDQEPAPGTDRTVPLATSPVDSTESVESSGRVAVSH